MFDRDGTNRLSARYRRLRGWAGGRLPRWARGLEKTSNRVQEALVRTLMKLEASELPRASVLLVICAARSPIGLGIPLVRRRRELGLGDHRVNRIGYARSCWRDLAGDAAAGGRR